MITRGFPAKLQCVLIKPQSRTLLNTFWALGREASGMLAQLCFQYEKREYSLGDHTLQGVKDPRAAIHNEPLAKKTIQKNGDWHERRGEPQPAYESGSAFAKPIE